jgi:hypothetical protein
MTRCPSSTQSITLGREQLSELTDNKLCRQIKTPRAMIYHHIDQPSTTNQSTRHPHKKSKMLLVLLLLFSHICDVLAWAHKPAHEVDPRSYASWQLPCVNDGRFGWNEFTD